MERTLVRTALAAFGLVLSGCSPQAGPGGIHEGDYFSAKLDGTVAAGFVSGWSGDRWVEVHKAGDLVQRIDLDRVTTFKVRCSHD